MDIHQILLRYWGYTSFRPLQEDIIHSVLDGKDTLALMPTGGGKSICFQVPALAVEGCCLVVTPLIALMKDQVDQLVKRGIKATAIYSGIHRDSINTAYMNCIYGGYKFLYLSPERLETESFRMNVQRMKINLLAVDESHCISHWGYDFRPSYLKIADIRKLLPNVPVLAVTATATEKVVLDIQKNLGFIKQNIFRKSFERKNLAYIAIKEEDKMGRLTRIVKNVKGSGVVYVRNRKRTREIAEFLNRQGFSADFYHAGLDATTREKKQTGWMKNRPLIMVSTNAFGMGIDKADVRFVVHMDLADSPEAYFQEAGRAGRDGKKSFAVILYDDADIAELNRQWEFTYPEIHIIRKIYRQLGNYLKIPVGAGRDNSFDFDLYGFSKRIDIKPFVVYNALNLLEKEGYIMLNDAVFQNSVLHIKVNKEELYRFQVKNPAYDAFIKVLLRSYAGLFIDFIKIKEQEIANRSSLLVKQVKMHLEVLHKENILTYLPKKEQAQVVFLKERLEEKQLYFKPEHYRLRKENARIRLETMIDYIENTTECRSRFISNYFGDKNVKRCGICDVCLERNKIGMTELSFDRIIQIIKPILQKEPMNIETLRDDVEGVVQEEKLLRVVHFLLDQGKLMLDEDERLIWKAK